jgi:hypothetical protein
MQKSNVALAATVAEAERTLAAVEPPKEVPEATAGQAGPSSATARKGESSRAGDAEGKQEPRRD